MRHVVNVEPDTAQAQHGLLEQIIKTLRGPDPAGPEFPTGPWRIDVDHLSNARAIFCIFFLQFFGRTSASK